MNTEQLVLLISLISLIVSGLAISIGFFSLYKLKRTYSDYRINWSKNIALWIMWTAIFSFSFGLLQHKNWGRFGLIIGLSILFVTITIITGIRLIGYVMLMFNEPELSNQFDENNDQIDSEYLGSNHDQDEEDLDELNYSEGNFQGEKDLDELNYSDDEGENDEIYYLDNWSENEEDFKDNSAENLVSYSFESYAKQGLIVTTIMAFISNLIIFALISFLQSTEVQHLMLN